MEIHKESFDHQLSSNPVVSKCDVEEEETYVAKNSQNKSGSIVNNHTITIVESQVTPSNEATASFTSESQIRNYTNENLEDVRNAKNILLTLQNLVIIGIKYIYNI